MKDELIPFDLTLCGICGSLKWLRIQSYIPGQSQGEGRKFSYYDFSQILLLDESVIGLGKTSKRSEVSKWTIKDYEEQNLMGQIIRRVWFHEIAGFLKKKFNTLDDEPDSDYLSIFATLGIN